MQDVNQIAQALIAGMGSYCDNTGICRQALRLLANGHPVAIQDVATTLQIPAAEVTTVLGRFSDVQYDDTGRITGKGLTLVSTPHQFFVKGHVLFTWCALDALMYPAILQQSARVESACAVTGTPVKMTVTPNEVKDVLPADVAVSIIVPNNQEVCCNIRSVFCNQVNFFHSPEAASTWLEEYPTAFALSINKAYQVGRIVAEHLYGGSTPLWWTNALTVNQP